MHIRGLVAHCLGQNSVDQANDGRIVLRIHQVAGLGDFIRQAAEVHIGADVFRHLYRFVIVALVGYGQTALELLISNPLQSKGSAKVAAQLS